MIRSNWGLPTEHLLFAPPWTSKLIFFSPLYFWPSMSRPSCVVYRCTVRSLLMTRSPCNKPFQLVNLGQCPPMLVRYRHRLLRCVHV